MIDSGSSSMSKNQKKRARKKQKKAAEEESGASFHGNAGGCEVREEKREKEVEKEVVVLDPTAELKQRLSEAKANQVG